MEDSITQWITQLAEGDQEAARALWERYYQRLVGLAREALGHRRLRFADEQDVALSAFDSFCAGAAAGRFPRLEDRECLWRLLVTITERKAKALLKYHRRRKRGGGKVRGDSCFASDGQDSSAEGFGAIAGPEPTPEYAAPVRDVYVRSMELLENDQQRRIAEYHLTGYTNEEIASFMGVSLRTVKRRLSRIRELWEAGAEP
jgi:RNA polymerase sigma factor (sigma-70 family)